MRPDTAFTSTPLEWDPDASAISGRQRTQLSWPRRMWSCTIDIFTSTLEEGRLDESPDFPSMCSTPPEEWRILVQEKAEPSYNSFVLFESGT